MDKTSKRRSFLKSVVAIPFITPIIAFRSSGTNRNDKRSKENIHALKVSLNAYSFNTPLTDGSMNIDDMLEFCAEKNFLAVDITAYYFPGYPRVPPDDYLYHVKRKAFSLGLEIGGTGVRNDFTEPDEVKRRESIELVKSWIVAAEKMGAPVIRIFSGNQNPVGQSRDQISTWMIKAIQECIAFGKAHGVVVAIQNHNDFLRTADDAIQIMKAINSEWFGLILDTGSYRIGDPYEEIAKSVSYAVNWQIKENVFVNGKEVEVDMDKLIGIIITSGYKGYIPIETLGEGDPKLKVSQLLDKVNKSLAKFN
ncbi:MAG: sugar phosphate isomerase/epimerase family protein [Bacteroidota bacterium]